MPESEGQEMIACPHCAAENLPDAAFCESCGKALPSSGSTGPRVVTEASGTKSRLATMHVLEDLRKQTKKAAGALLAVAILQAVFGAVIIMILKGNDQEVPPIVYISIFGIAVAFFGLFLWARKSPFPAAIAGLVLFVTLHGLEAVADPKSLANGWLVKLIIIVILVNAIKAGQKHRIMARSISEEA
jgi:heme A synthase